MFLRTAETKYTLQRYLPKIGTVPERFTPKSRLGTTSSRDRATLGAATGRAYTGSRPDKVYFLVQLTDEKAFYRDQIATMVRGVPKQWLPSNRPPRPPWTYQHTVRGVTAIHRSAAAASASFRSPRRRAGPSSRS